MLKRLSSLRRDRVLLKSGSGRMDAAVLPRAPAAALALVGVLFAGALGPTQASCPQPPGDVNGSGDTSIVDVQCMIIAVLQAPVAPPCLVVSPALADATCDSALTVGDILITIRWTLGSPLSPVVDADGSNCPDLCERPSSAVARALWATTPSESASFRLTPTGGAVPVATSQSSSFRLSTPAVAD